MFREEVKKELEKVLKRNKVYARVSLDITGNIRIWGRDVNAWIRLSEIGFDDRVVNQVNINSIYITPEKQRRGIFTLIMSCLKSLKVVDSLIVTSVCTESMHSWCKKNNCLVVATDFSNTPYDYRYK